MNWNILVLPTAYIKMTNACDCKQAMKKHMNTKPFFYQQRPDCQRKRPLGIKCVSFARHKL